MEQTSLESRALHLKTLYGEDCPYKGRRLQAERDRAIHAVSQKLSGLIRSYVKKKQFQDAIEDADQHAMIAIHKAIQSWDPSISTFSTYFTWQLRAELSDLNQRYYPERRRIAVNHPIVYVELDKKIPNSMNYDYGATAGDFLEDERANANIEANVNEYMTFRMMERIWSHYIADEMEKYSETTKDLGSLAEKRRNLMRMRHIHILRTFEEDTNAVICAEFDISRERVRQINAKVNEMLKDRVPRYDPHLRAIRNPKIPLPADIHPSWPQMLAEYFDACGLDEEERKKLLIIEMDLPKSVTPYDFTQMGDNAGVVSIESVNMDEPVMIKPCDNGRVVEGQQPVMVLIEGNPNPPQATKKIMPAGRKRRSLPTPAALALAAGAMLAAVSPAAAQTRAVPPGGALPVFIDNAPSSSVNAVKSDPVLQAPAQIVEPQRPAAMHGPMPELIRASRIKTAKQFYGISIANAASFAEAASVARNIKSKWSAVKNFVPAFQDEAKYSGEIIFGPLSKEKASQLCIEAEKLFYTCKVSEYGQPVT